MIIFWSSVKLNRTCPLDRKLVQDSDIVEPRRYFRNLLANLKLHCPFCSGETTHEEFERHKNNCAENPEAATECTFCSVEYIVEEEEQHKDICIPFLQHKIAAYGLKDETERTNFQEDIERLVKGASGSRKVRYILTWNAELPTPQNHQQTGDKYFYTWNCDVGNLVDGTRVRNDFWNANGTERNEMGTGTKCKKCSGTRSVPE